METLADRIKVLIGDGSANSFARKCGIGESSLRQYLSGSMPSADNAAKIAKTGSVSLDWLVTGEGERGASGQTQTRFNDTITRDDFRLIPRLDVEASAGNGMLAQHENELDLLAFRSDWLHRMGISPRAARILTARGDSMEPTIRDGDILLVDTSIDRVMDNAIYVVVLGGLVLVKRIQVRRDGSLDLISDNTAFSPETVPANEAASLHIAGRVMWFGRKI